MFSKIIRFSSIVLALLYTDNRTPRSAPVHLQEANLISSRFSAHRMEVSKSPFRYKGVLRIRTNMLDDIMGWLLLESMASSCLAEMSSILGIWLWGEFLKRFQVKDEPYQKTTK